MRRKVFTKVINEMDRYRIAILLGLRRTGKTTILKQIQEIHGEKAYFLNFDNITIRTKDDLTLYNMIEEQIKKGKTILLFDEIQVRENWDILLKNIFDEYMYDKKVKVAVTGSSSLNFAGKDTGVTRSYKIVVPPFDYDEYLELSGEKKCNETFEKYFGEGGFPEFINSKSTFSERADEILKPIIFNDISSQYSVDPSNLLQFIYYLAELTNGELNKDKVCNALKVKAAQIDRYISILKSAQLIKVVSKLNENFMRGKYSRHKIYLNPHILLWILNKDFNTVSSKYIGLLTESYYLFSRSSVDGYYQEYFYAKNDKGYEVDLVEVNQASKELYKAFEFKYRDDATTKSYVELMNFRAKEKIVVCKEDKVFNGIKFVDIKNIDFSIK